MKKPKVYISSRYVHSEKWRLALENNDTSYMEVISDWFNKGYSNDPDLYNQFIEQIKQCDILVLFTFKSDPRLVGALIETGAAMALGKHVFIVGQECPGDIWKYDKAVWVQVFSHSHWTTFERTIKNWMELKKTLEKKS